MSNSIAASNRWRIAGAFLAGVALTAGAMSLLRPHPEPAMPAAQEEHAGGEHAAGGVITLTPEAVARAGIRVETAGFDTIREVLVVPGTVEVRSANSARVTPPVAGKVVRVHVRLGDRVRRGQPMVTLDSFEVAQAHAALRQASAAERDARARVATAGAEIDQARAGVDQARAEQRQAETRLQSARVALARQQELAKAGAFSQSPLQAAQSEVSEAQSELLRAQSELQAHEASLRRAERLFKEGIASRAELEQAQLEFRQDQARVEQARARKEIADRAMTREQKLFQSDLLTRQAVQGAEAEVRAAEADVQRGRQGVVRAERDVSRARKEALGTQTALAGARETVAAARANLQALEGAGHTGGEGGEVILFAPFDGTVAELHATLGEAVERSSALVVLENLNTVTVQANVPEQEAARVRQGQPVTATVDALPGQRFTGVVENVSTRVDEKTRALTVRCTVANPGGKLKAEMFARVELGTSAARRALTVPRDAVVELEGKPHLFVRTEQGFEPRETKAGREQNGRLEILEGLRSGEQVVTAGAFTLSAEANKSELSEEGHD